MNGRILAETVTQNGERGAWGQQLNLDLPPVSMQWWRFVGKTTPNKATAGD